jgi:hypothetical protein
MAIVIPVIHKLAEVAIAPTSMSSLIRDRTPDSATYNDKCYVQTDDTAKTDPMLYSKNRPRKCTITRGWKSNS